jgi:hypothetical protein
MKSRTIQWLGFGLILLIGLIHLYKIPQEYEEVHYMGYLFAANFLGTVLASVRIRRSNGDSTWGWWLGLIVAAGSIVGYVWSRTTGMPGMEMESWLDPVGLLSLVAEVGFIVLALTRLPLKGMIGERRVSKHIAVILGLETLILVGLVVNIWDARSMEISQETLKDEYGVELRLIGRTNLGGNLDFRLFILDAQKAEKLLGQDHSTLPVLLVEGSNLRLIAPEQHHHHTDLNDGDIYYLMYPNPGSVVRAGTPVSVEFGNLRLEPVPVQ